MSLTLKRALSVSSTAPSYIGRKPLELPKGVQIIPSFRIPPTPPQGNRLQATPDRHVAIKGPKGQLELDLLPFVSLSEKSRSSTEITGPVSETQLTVSVLNPSSKSQRAGWGLTRALLNNAIQGVSLGYSVSLRLVGVGYRATLDTRKDGTQTLVLKLGYSHNINLPLPKSVRATVPAPTQITLAGIDKQEVFQYASKIRSYRKPEPYNGKGVFVGDETITRKEIRKK